MGAVKDVHEERHEVTVRWDDKKVAVEEANTSRNLGAGGKVMSSLGYVVSGEEHGQHNEMFEDRHGVATQGKGREVTTGVFRPWKEQQAL